MRTEYQQIFDKVKKLINEQKEKKVIRIDNILNKLFQWDSIDELIDFNYNLERTLQCHPLDRIRGIFGSHLISGQSIMRGWHSYTLYSTLIVFKPPCKEFESLRKYLAKYARYELEVDKFYMHQVFGKRNDMEIRNSSYLAYEPNLCKKVLAWLRENKATNYKIIIKERHTLDRGDDEYAYRAEREWYGVEYNKMEIILETKTTRKVSKSATFTSY